MEKGLYFYRGKVVYVYDGDTITVDIDLGLKVLVHGEKIRLNKINTPEIRGEERPDGLKSHDYLRNLIMNKSIFIETIKDRQGKYGRYLGEIYLPDENEKLINENNLFVEKGVVEYREY